MTDETGETAGRIGISTTRTVPGSNLPSACLITWDGEQWLASVDDVRVTAMDMVECAVLADLMLLLIVKLKLPSATLAALLSDLISRPGKTRFGALSTLTMTPIGSTRKRPPTTSVLLEHGSHHGMVDSDTVRSMAQQWLEVAEAVDSDRHVVQALRALQAPEDFEGVLFAQLFRQRTGNAGHD